MREVRIVGAAMTPFGKHRNTTVADLGQRVVVDALRDAGVAPKTVEAAYCGNVLGGMMVGQRVLRDLGMGSIPVVNIENACSSSAAALREAYLAVSAGIHETVLVLGVEQLSALGGGQVPLDPTDHEASNGQIMPAVYAMRAHRYLEERELTPADLAQVAVKARRHGALNPHAQFRTPVTVEQVLDSRMIAAPLTLFQCCPTGDGAAALVLTAAEDHQRLASGPPVRIRASVLHSGQLETGFRDMTNPTITAVSARQAHEQAGVDPADLDVVELHDAFTIAELLYYEALGLCDRGDAIGLLRSGATSFGGSPVVNPSGGLLAKGHPLGATGAAQVVEVVWQLRGQADERQVPGARLGLTHATGGGLSGVDHGACTVHILERTTR